MSAHHIMRCTECWQYTMQDKCPSCGSKTRDPKPLRYSPPDKYGKYRRIALKELMKNE
ncbi:MAG: RNA-protein complex protein Nop10 [Candidatus Aenigmarchaeota archaeon]|nr:RNA-protein complex protein Nop10 [Candidatus Aenigmarchaeota archaeon]